jgi:collagenase-like PrtC family protease
MQKAGGVKNAIRLNWIRPEDLKYYVDAGIFHFKIQGRQNILQGDIIKTLKHYFSEDYDGNLFDLITLFAPYNSFQPYMDNKKLDGFIKTFYIKPDFCKDMCDSCGYCESYARKCMETNHVEELNAKALSFYSNMDSYTKVLRNYRGTQQKKLSDEGELNLDFDF